MGGRKRPKGTLLALLALYPGKTFRRDEVIADLGWEMQDEGGRNRLRVELFHLRRALEPPGVSPGSVLKIQENEICLLARAVKTDFSHFDALYDEFQKTDSLFALTTAIDLYCAGGDLLTDFDFPRLTIERERCRQRFEDMLRIVVARQEAEGDLFSALQYVLTARHYIPEAVDFDEIALRLTLAAANDRGVSERWERLHRLFGEQLPEDMRRLEQVLLPTTKTATRKQASRTRVPRTVRQAVEARLTTLSRTDRAVLRQLSVFAGSFLAEAAVFVLRRPHARHLQDILTRLLSAGLVTQEEQRYRIVETFRPFLVAAHNPQDRRYRHCLLAVWLRRCLKSCYAAAGSGDDYHHEIHLAWLQRLLVPEWENLCGIVEENLFHRGALPDDQQLRFGIKVGLHYFNTAGLAGEPLRHAGWLVEGLRHFQRLNLRYPFSYLLTCLIYSTDYPTDPITQELIERTWEAITDAPTTFRERQDGPASFPANAAGRREHAAATLLPLLSGTQQDVYHEIARTITASHNDPPLRHNVGKMLCELAALKFHQQQDTQAHELFSQGIALLKSPQERLDAQGQWAEALWVRGDFERAQVAFQEGLAQAREIRNSREYTTFTLRYGDFLHLQGECYEAQELLERVVENSFGRSKEMVTIKEGRLDNQLGGLHAAALRSLGHLYVTRGRFGAASPCFHLARDITLSSADIASASDAERGLALILLRTGHLAEAQKALAKAKEVWQKADHARWLSVFSLHQAEASFYQEDTKQALLWIAEAETQAQRTSAPSSLSGAWYLRARIAAYNGDTSTALTHYKEALRLQLRHCGKRHLLPTIEGIAEAMSVTSPLLAAEMLTLTEVARRDSGILVPPIARSDYDRWTSTLHANVVAQESRAEGKQTVLPGDFFALCRHLSQSVFG